MDCGTRVAGEPHWGKARVKHPGPQIAAALTGSGTRDAAIGSTVRVARELTF